MQTFPRLRRRSLWLILIVLIAGLLGMLMWLAGRYEASVAQDRLERDALDAVTVIRSAMLRNVQALQALEARAGGPSPAWEHEATDLLNAHREMLRIERRDAALRLGAAVDSPLRPPVFNVAARDAKQGDLELTCALARRTSGHAYGTSYLFLARVARAWKRWKCAFRSPRMEWQTGIWLRPTSSTKSFRNWRRRSWPAAMSFH